MEQNYITNMTKTTRLNRKINSNKTKETTSIVIFEEEPVFSNSDEEDAYEKRLKKQIFQHIPDRVLQMRKKDEEVQCNLTKMVDAKVQCDLGVNNYEIKKILTLCEDIEIENVNEDYKELILLCKKLQHRDMYETPPQSRTQSKNTVINDETQKFTPLNCEMDSNNSAHYLPSRNSNAYVKECPFLESFSSLSNDSSLGVSELINKVSVDNNENNIGPKRTRRNMKKSKLTQSEELFRNKTSKENKNILKKAPKKSAISVKRKQKKTIENVILDFHRNVKTKKRKSNIQSKSLICNSASEGDQENVFIKVSLPTNKVRSLARNWMKPEKEGLIGYKDLVSAINRGCTSLPLRPTFRCLYSPNQWMDSEEYAHLRIPDFKKSSSLFLNK